VLTERVRPGDTSGDLLARLSEAGAPLLVATLDGIADGSLRSRPQPPDGVSYAPKLTVADARIDFAQPALAVDRRIRACTPEPGAWAPFRDGRLKLGPVQLLADAAPLAAAELLVAKTEVLVGTATSPVRLGLVQPAGKRPMPAADWARGLRLRSGDRLG
jgi:methionyl-tRNA formyltransferase